MIDDIRQTKKQWRQDQLRLLALSRIPRCADCARLAALLAAHEAGVPLDPPPPRVPAHCRHQVCAPLVVRLTSWPQDGATPGQQGRP